MKRREFIAAATAAMLVSPSGSLAQGARRRPGFLAIGDGIFPNRRIDCEMSGIRFA